MNDSDILVPAPDAKERRRAGRRHFLRSASVATLAFGGSALLSACGGSGTSTPSATDSSTPTPSPSSTDTLNDQDSFNFLLNLAYLQAQFYTVAVTGAGLPNALIAKGDGNQTVQGAVTGGRQVTFTDPLVAQSAREIAADKVAHVAFLRSALGAATVAQPAINIDGSASGAFSALAQAATVVAAGAAFDPYASDENFLLAAFMLEDVVVTAYTGRQSTIATTLLIDAAAGIHATTSYHAGLIRTVLYAKGSVSTPSLLTNAGLISNARDAFDGSTDLDQGIVGDSVTSNISPLDSNGLALARTAGQVLNVLYLNKNAVVGGGFFPGGVNGNIKTSAAN